MTEHISSQGAANNNASQAAQNSASSGAAASVSRRRRAETDAVSVNFSARASELSRLKDQNTASAAASSNEQQVQEKSASSEKVAASSPQRIGANSVSGGVLSWLKSAASLWASGDSRFQSKDAASEKGASGLSWDLNSSKTAAGNGAGTLSTPGSKGIEKETATKAEDGSKGPIGWADIEVGKMGATTPNDKASGVANQSPLGAEKKVDNKTAAADAEKPQPASQPIKQEGLLVSNKTDEKPGDFSGSENDGAENTNPLREFIQKAMGGTAETMPFGGIAQPGAQENKITSPLEKMKEEQNQSPLNAGNDLLSKVEKEVGKAEQAVGKVADKVEQTAAKVDEKADQITAKVEEKVDKVADTVEKEADKIAANAEKEAEKAKKEAEKAAAKIQKEEEKDAASAASDEEKTVKIKPKTDKVVTPAEIRKENEDDEENTKSEKIDKEDMVGLKDLLEDLESAQKTAQKTKEKLEDQLGFMTEQQGMQVFGTYFPSSSETNAQPSQPSAQESGGQTSMGRFKGFVRVNNEHTGTSVVIQNSPAFYMGSQTETAGTANRAGGSFSGRSLSNIQRGLSVYRSLEEMTG